ncbi:MAG: hypothetical protein ABSF10_01505 [Verrucomicrobiota bacterium]|jgi:hypothetical protein
MFKTLSSLILSGAVIAANALAQPISVDIYEICGEVTRGTRRV